MDKVSNRLAAFIIDAGKHSEFSFVDGAESKPLPVRYRTTSDSRYISVGAESLIFSHGIKVDLQQVTVSVEMMVGVVPNDPSVFAIDNADSYHPREMLHIYRQLEGKNMRDCDIPRPSSEAYRNNYRYVFGFDGKVLNAESLSASFKDRSTKAGVPELTENDHRSEALLALLFSDEDAALNKRMEDSGILFVALRVVEAGQPKPVFWANGHFTDSRGTDDVLVEDVFHSIRVIAERYIQTRYLNSIFAKAHGFCPNLKV